MRSGRQGLDVSIQPWIPSALGALFAASAFIAWKIRPKWERDVEVAG